MVDNFNITASFDKPLYNVGDTMVLTVLGTVTNGSTVPVTASVIVTAADSTTSTLTATSAVGGEAETWTIAVTDTGNRTWTIATVAGGFTATATA